LDRTKSLLSELRDTTASVYMIPDISMLGLLQARADHLDGVPVIALCENPVETWPSPKKRATDVVLASLMLVVALPLMAAICLAIKATSRGPVIIRERRYALDGERIDVYRFRTTELAAANAEAGAVTPIGRFLRR